LLLACAPIQLLPLATTATTTTATAATTTTAAATATATATTTTTTSTRTTTKTLQQALALQLALAIPLEHRFNVIRTQVALIDDDEKRKTPKCVPRQSLEEAVGVEADGHDFCS
jgi:hypothetical protein